MARRGQLAITTFVVDSCVSAVPVIVEVRRVGGCIAIADRWGPKFKLSHYFYDALFHHGNLFQPVCRAAAAPRGIHSRPASRALPCACRLTCRVGVAVLAS